ncbi:MAG: zinc-binding dehydrogenase [Saprospirales bacterium]|nr:zinc-binding dehydrogenase [Saprospirales bacterium]
MKALVLIAADTPPTIQEIPDPVARDGEVVVDIAAGALNHRDVWIMKGKYPGIRYPAVLGSDGAGWLDGKPVLLNPSLQWGDNPAAQSKDYHILGLPTQGTFATRVAVPRANVLEAPAHLSMEQAAAIPLAGLTAYRALFSRAELRAGERVLISGIGGGVALFAFQFALAVGAEVYVTSGSDEKIGKAMEMGAKGGANYRKEEWVRQLKTEAGGFEVVIDSAAGPGFPDLISLLQPAGRIVLYGGTQGAIPSLNPQQIFWRQINIMGSTMGHADEFADMIAFIDQHRIVPVVDAVFPLSEGPAAFDRMAKGLQFGKIVLQIDES